jgi:hypothetical protein
MMNLEVGIGATPLANATELGLARGSVGAREDPDLLLSLLVAGPRPLPFL